MHGSLDIPMGLFAKRMSSFSFFSFSFSDMRNTDEINFCHSKDSHQK